jgi:hypothetical protein
MQLTTERPYIGGRNKCIDNPESIGWTPQKPSGDARICETKIKLSDVLQGAES